MTAPHTTDLPACDLNHLERGKVYFATTRYGTAVGEYLGMETPFGDRSILLRDAGGTASIATRDVTSILPLAA